MKLPRSAPSASLLLTGAAIVLAGPLGAQWSSDPLANLAVADASGGQALPKVAATGDGSTWIGWFDPSSGNYDVRVQLLDPDGVEQFAHAGLLVSAHPQNSQLFDWDLDADLEGNAILVFSDARAGFELDVYAYRISPSGQFLWGADGVTLSSNADFEAAPKIVATDDGEFVCVWARLPNPGDGTIRIQRLDAAGATLYPAEGLAISGSPGEDPGFCDVVAAEDGAFVVQWLRDIATFASPRHIRARKFDAAGAPLWAAPVSVYDLSSVPIAYQPVVQSDGAGGALFAWHRALGSTFDCLVQRVDASGNEVFAHDGVVVSTEANRQEFSPSLAYLPASGDMIVAFDKRNAAQSQWGVGAQRISASGARLWTDSGVELLAVDGITKSFVRCVPFGDGAQVYFFESSGFASTRVLGLRVDGAGASVWGATPIVVSSLLSAKDDLEVALDGSGVARLAWHDERADAGDVYAQNVAPDGALGDASACSTSTYCVGAPNSAGPGASIGSSGSTSVALNGFTLNATGCPPGVSAYFIYGPSQVQVPLGDGFRCVGGALSRLRPAQSTSASGTIERYVDMTAPPADSGAGALLPGTTFHFQLWYRDPFGPGGNGTNLSNALSASFCP